MPTNVCLTPGLVQTRGVAIGLLSDLTTFKNISFCKKETEAFCPLMGFLVPNSPMGWCLSRRTTGAEEVSGSVHSPDSSRPPSLSLLYLPLLFHVMSFVDIAILSPWVVCKLLLERPGIVFHSCLLTNLGNLSNFLKMTGEMGPSFLSAGKTRPLFELLEISKGPGLSPAPNTPEECIPSFGPVGFLQ